MKTPIYRATHTKYIKAANDGHAMDKALVLFVGARPHELRVERVSNFDRELRARLDSLIMTLTDEAEHNCQRYVTPEDLLAALELRGLKVVPVGESAVEVQRGQLTGTTPLVQNVRKD